MKVIALAFGIVPFAPQDEPKAKAPPPPGLDVTLQHVYDRHFTNDWLPLVMRLDNRTGRDIDAEVEVRCDEYLPTRVTRRESLSRGARKRLFFYLPLGPLRYAMEPNYRVTDGSGRVLAAGRMAGATRFSNTQDYQIAIFSGDAAAAPGFGMPREVSGVSVEVSRLTPDRLPDAWIGLKCLDLLLIHDAPLDALSPEQARAIADYVRQGGTAVLSPGANVAWLSHPALAAFVDARVQRSEEVSGLPGLATDYARFDRPETFLFHRLVGGEAFVGVARDREIVLYRSGFGRVIVLPFDLRRPPFDRWPGLEPLWQALILRTPRHFSDEGGLSLAGTPSKRHEILQSMSRLQSAYPSFFLLTFLAGLFVLAVGPANYLLLRRLRMTLLTVVTVPLISVLFLGVVFATGYALRGISTVAHSVRIVTTRPGVEIGRETELFSLFAASTRAYDIGFPAGAWALPSERAGVWTYDFWPGRDLDQMSRAVDCEQGTRHAYRRVAVGQWQHAGFVARSMRDLGAGVSYEVDGAVVRIRNGSPHAMERGVVVRTGVAGDSTPFGPVAPGATVEVPLARGKMNPVDDLGFAPGTLGADVLEPFLREVASFRGARHSALPSSFLVAVLRDERPAIRVDASLSSASRSLTLLIAVPGAE
jgi:hypothetical protein